MKQGIKKLIALSLIGLLYTTNVMAGICVSSLAKVQTDNVFAPTSFWYQPIPLDVELHPNSANFVNEILRQKTKYYGTVNINTVEYSSPVYTVPADAPTVAVGWNDCQKKGYVETGLLAQLTAVPIPANATAAVGNDKEMTIYQPSTDTLWELWMAVKDPDGKWRACWGGKLANASLSNGVFPNRYGTTATSLPFLGGQITAEELERGEIKHAIGLSLVELEHFNIYSWPATRSDGWNPAPAALNRIAEGQRLRFDPTIDPDTIPGITRAGKIIFIAAQKYGFVVWDRAGALSIRVQNASSYPSNPYPALFDNKYNYEIMKNFPWNKLQFLPFNYGKPL